MSLNQDQAVLFEELKGQEGDVGLITLNRPEVLNSLNHKMILAMRAQLQSWETASHIKAVVITAAPGKAFCAGGDLRFTYQHLQHVKSFFSDEYELNKMIFHYPKPYIALLNGITMGGGVGIAIHGSHRLATDNLVFAMPETGIGFFPDVGGTYFLPRLPFSIGFYLGLTGVKLNADDCCALGLVQQKIRAERLAEFIHTLTLTPLPNRQSSVDEMMQLFSHTPQQNREVPSSLMSHQWLIEECFSHPTIEDIFHALQNKKNDFCQQTLQLLQKKSPTSLKVSLLAMQRGKLLEFDECMKQEYRLTCHFLKRSDFIEGIRAVIIDKDQLPQWKPASIEAVSDQAVLQYFSPLGEEVA